MDNGMSLLGTSKAGVLPDNLMTPNVRSTLHTKCWPEIPAERTPKKGMHSNPERINALSAISRDHLVPIAESALT